MTDTYLTDLIRLYHAPGKHSGYQRLPPSLASIFSASEPGFHGRYEEERLAFVLSTLELSNRSVIDIGGNLGYFSFEALRLGATSVSYFDGNTQHAEFVKKAGSFLGFDKSLSVHGNLFDFDDTDITADVVFLLNVLHHVGDDFGKSTTKKSDAIFDVARVIQRLAQQTRHLIFQIGYNWKGDVSQPLFLNGSKADVISFIQETSEKVWDIAAIGIAERRNGGIEYRDLTEFNKYRDESMGEFLNRPLFIMKSRLLP